MSLGNLNSGSWLLKEFLVWIPSHGAGTDTGWIFPHILITIAWHILWARQTVHQRLCKWVGIYISFSFRSLQSNFLHQIHYNVGMEAPCRYQLDFSMFYVLCGCCFLQWYTVVSLPRATHCLSNSLGLYIFMWSPCSTTRLSACSPTTGSLVRE